MANGWSTLPPPGAESGGFVPAGSASSSSPTTQGTLETPAPAVQARPDSSRGKRPRRAGSSADGGGTRRGPARGVTFDEVTGKWRVRLRMQGGKETALGYYWDPDVAVQAVQLARQLQAQGVERLRISNEVKRAMLPLDKPELATDASAPKRACRSDSPAPAAAAVSAEDGFMPVAGVQLMRNATTGALKWRTYYVKQDSQPAFVDVAVKGQATEQLPMIVTFLQAHCPDTGSR